MDEWITLAENGKYYEAVEVALKRSKELKVEGVTKKDIQLMVAQHMLDTGVLKVVKGQLFLTKENDVNG